MTKTKDKPEYVSSFRRSNQGSQGRKIVVVLIFIVVIAFVAFMSIPKG